MQPGVIIRKRRKTLGISQSALADGICTQGLISQIESGQIVPTADLLYAIARRLRLTLEECFYVWDEEREYAECLHQEMKKCIRFRTYKELPRLVRDAKKNKYFKSSDLLVLLLWMDSLAHFYIKKNINEAMRLIDLAIGNLPSTKSLRAIELKNTKGIYHSEQAQFEMAYNIYKEALHLWTELEVKSDSTLDIRIRHNMSKTCYAIKNYSEALFHCLRAIERCVEEDTLCLFADLHYLKGQILYCMGKKEDSYQSFIFTKMLFETSGQSVFLKITTDKIAELFSEANNSQSTL